MSGHLPPGRRASPDRGAPPDGSTPTGARRVPDPVAAAARRAPGSPALVDGPLRLTWADLAARVADAAWLLREAGLERGDRLAVVAGPSAAFVVLVHAARAAGVVLVPLAPRAAAHELAWQVDHVAPRLLLHDAPRAALAASALAMLEGPAHPPALDLSLVAGPDEGAEHAAGPDEGAEHAAGEAPASPADPTAPAVTGTAVAPPVAPAGPTAPADPVAPAGPTAPAVTGTAVAPPAAAPLPPVDPSARATIVFTSGTTGRPKGAVLTWGNHLASARAWAGVLDPRPTDRWLLALPTHHVAGIGTIVRAAVAGAAVVCAGDGFDAGHVAALLRDEAITHVSVVATTLERLLAALPPAGPGGSLRAVLLGGGPWPPDLALRAVAAGLPIVTTYGMTETASGVAALPADLVATHPAASGRALAGARITVDADGRPAGPGEIGEIVVVGPMVFAGYLDDPDATSGALRDGRLHTGDLGSLDADGILTVADRRDDLIVSGGENVYPAEVEAVLRAHPDIVDAGVVGVPDAAWGAVPAAVVVARPGSSPTPDGVRALARERIAGNKVPARVAFVAEIPRTAAGKIVRRDLRALLDAAAAGAPAVGAAAPLGGGSGGGGGPGGSDVSAAPPARLARSLVRDRSRIAYGVTGSGPGVVLLHATLSRGRAWLPVERRLATRATVVSIDRRGHRASPDADPMRLTIADHVADVAAVIEAEAVAPALVVGHSFGGCVALELAARRPELVAGVVAYEPPYLALAGPEVRDALARVGAATAAAHAAGNAPLAAEIFLRAVLGDAGYAALPAGVRAAVLQQGDAAASDARLAGLEPGGLARIRVPVIVAVGSGSSALYRSVADAIVVAVPGARVVTVPGADHMAPVTRPESILPIIDGAFDAAFAPVTPP